MPSVSHATRAAGMLLLAACVPGFSQDLTSMSLRELIDIDVTSVSKKPRSQGRSPAAVFVISRQDIRRSAATSIPELLRMVPGLNVARVDSNKWAISARGFNGRWANKLLVMVDGRTVYSPIFAGVYWDVQDVPMEDIERIEVIRGPGATMWGANAVNGVISIVTRRAADTQGGMITATAGNHERGSGTVRYGGELGSRVRYRAFSRYVNRDRLDTTAGPGLDQWSVLRGGFRLDWDPSRDDTVTVEGDLYRGRTGQLTRALTLQPPYAFTFGDTARPSGGSLLARWRHNGRSGAETQAQFYYDRTRRGDSAGLESVDTYDFDMQHRLARMGRHDLQFGLDARFTSAALTLRPAAPARLEPFGDGLVGMFAQDEVSLLENRLSLVLGSKFERNGYTGLEVQPTAQLLYTPNAVHSAWASVSRAVRLPALVDRVARMDLAAMPSGDAGLPMLLSIFGNPDLHSETLLAYEAGYRINPAPWFSADLAAYYNVYGRLRTTEPSIPYFEPMPRPPHLVMPLVAGNQLGAAVYGLETVANWQPAPVWKLSTSYAWMGAGLDPSPTSHDVQVERVRADSPRHQAQLRSYLDLPGNLTADASVAYTGALAAVPTARPRIPGYARVDARLGWRPNTSLELGAGVENLLDRRYTEFIETWGTLAAQTVTGRRAYAKLTVYF